MDDVLATLATPFYALIDFALDAPGPTLALAFVAVGIAITLLTA